MNSKFTYELLDTNNCLEMILYLLSKNLYNVNATCYINLHSSWIEYMKFQLVDNQNIKFTGNINLTFDLLHAIDSIFKPFKNDFLCHMNNVYLQCIQNIYNYKSNSNQLAHDSQKTFKVAELLEEKQEEKQEEENVNSIFCSMPENSQFNKFVALYGEDTKCPQPEKEQYKYNDFMDRTYNKMKEDIKTGKLKLENAWKNNDEFKWRWMILTYLKMQKKNKETFDNYYLLLKEEYDELKEEQINNLTTEDLALLEDYLGFKDSLEEMLIKNTDWINLV